MAPLPLLAQYQLTTKSDTTGTYCSRLLANGAQRGPLPMPLRLSQSNRHSNGKQRYRESPQHAGDGVRSGPGSRGREPTPIFAKFLYLFS